MSYSGQIVSESDFKYHANFEKCSRCDFMKDYKKELPYPYWYCDYYKKDMFEIKYCKCEKKKTGDAV